ncbi:MAG: hypothetical protein A2W91_11665 [Bacteroidetes bacterium GWF2_38_335]|nr:MAG: hypothetical protein A2W91_11665 [Bacteroidetes bacterium GWF2_38_335]OFY77936.1 MAG: hypothetical protein A2281_18410 [Bacteroidetes bacterium RIFOXYA12_FULL_38_20]HBS86677.1 hypothetical protein [Bacteroidales bacterium]
MVSLITVNYNCEDEIDKLISSTISYLKIPYELIIVDNNSEKNKYHSFKSKYSNIENIKFIDLDANYGFAEANNRGSDAAKYNILHFINPDILFNEQANQLYYELEKFSLNNQIFVNPLIENDGKYMSLGFAIPTVKNYLKKIFKIKGVKKWYIGASIVLDKRTFGKINKWSNDYFMYSEDLDLFYKSHLMKIEIIELNTPLFHIGKASSSKVWTNYQRAKIIENSLKLFYKKYNISYQYYLIRIPQLIYLLLTDYKNFKISFNAVFNSSPKK